MATKAVFRNYGEMAVHKKTEFHAFFYGCVSLTHTYLILFLITDWGQGSPFPARFGGNHFIVPLDAKVQLCDSLEETVEVENVGIPAEF